MIKCLSNSTVVCQRRNEYQRICFKCFNENEVYENNNVHFLHVNNVKKPITFYIGICRIEWEQSNFRFKMEIIRRDLHITKNTVF